MTPDESEASTSCPSCGEENAATARFCSACGAKLGPSGVGEERKLISVLFVDLVGFTTRSDGADPEDVRDVLRAYHSHVKGRIEEYGGVVEKFVGDAVMAVFGAPVAHGDDAERAVRAGLRVLASIGELNGAEQLDLAVRAAVNTGEAVVAPGGEKTGEALAMGDVVNSASRLQASAPENRLIVGALTHRATRHVIEYEPAEAISAKGKAEPLEAWLALTPSLAPAERRMRANPLVGRQHEVELMQSIWARCVSERRPYVITVLGPPGIGKSRLSREVSERVAAEDGRILRGRSLPYEEQTGYESFSHLLRSATGILDSDPPALMRDKLDAAVGRLLPENEAAETGKHLALLLGLRAEESALDPGLLYFAARRFVESLASEQPTLLVFEDVHWARESEVALLEYLIKHVRDSPVVFIATARPEFLDTQPTWGGGLVAHTVIPLEPLGREDAADLAAGIAAGAGSFDLDRLVEVSEGNPLFLEELVASVLELGDAAGIPVTVKEAIASRIDVLPGDARATLLAAAVVGRTFWANVLTAISEVHETEDALALLEARELIRREPISQIAGTAQYTFKHVLIREVAYSTVPRSARGRLHGAVARYIEEAGGESTELLAWALAHHWAEAGEPARAVPYLLAAAETALRSWAHGTAVDLFTRALELSTEDGQRREILLRRGLALVELDDFGRASDELAVLIPDLEGKDLFDALIGRGIAVHWLELDQETLATAERALAVATELGTEAELASARALLSQGYAMRGAEGDLEKALEIGQAAFDTWPPGSRGFELANHLHLLADFTYWTGRYERTRDLAVRARAQASDAFSPEALLRGGGMEALALVALGRHEEAIRIWEEQRALAAELGRNPRTILNYSSIAYRELLDLDEARRRSEEALELSEGETFGMPRRFAQSDLLQVHLLAGDVGRAQSLWPGYWSDAENATAWTRWLIYGRLAVARAEIALVGEGAESTLEWARRALELAVRTQRRKYEARARSVLGEGYARRGQRDEALSELRLGVAIADELIGPPARWHARAALGRAAYTLGDDETAAKAYEEAAELVQGFASALSPERAANLLRAPAIAEILSLTRPTTTG